VARNKYADACDARAAKLKNGWKERIAGTIKKNFEAGMKNRPK